MVAGERNGECGLAEAWTSVINANQTDLVETEHLQGYP